MFKVISVLGATTILTACIVVETPNHSPAPQIIIQPNSGASLPHTYLKKVKIKTYDGCCLDLSGSNQRDLLAHRCHYGKNQRFTFHPVRSIQVQGKCLDVAGQQQQNGAEVIGYRCNGQKNQKWYIDGQRIRSLDTGKCLDIYNGKMQMHHCSQNRGQKFNLIAL